jgi:hypothetical protein
MSNQNKINELRNDIMQIMNSSADGCFHCRLNCSLNNLSGIDGKSFEELEMLPMTEDNCITKHRIFNMEREIDRIKKEIRG